MLSGWIPRSYRPNIPLKRYVSTQNTNTTLSSARRYFFTTTPRSSYNTHSVHATNGITNKTTEDRIVNQQKRTLTNFHKTLHTTNYPYQTLQTLNNHIPLHIPARLMSTRTRLREAFRGEYLRWRSKQDEKARNETRITCFGWIRLGPEPVHRMKSKDIRGAKDFKYYQENTTKWEKIKDSLDSQQFLVTWYARLAFGGIISSVVIILVLIEAHYRPTEKPGWFEGSLSPDVRKRLRTEIYPLIGWDAMDSDGTVNKQALISGRDGGTVTLSIDPEESPLLAKSNPDELQVLIYHDEYAVSDKTKTAPKALYQNNNKDNSSLNGTDGVSTTPSLSESNNQLGPSQSYKAALEEAIAKESTVPIEVLIGITNPKDYLSTYLTHLPPTAPFPTQKQINEATRFLLRAPPIPQLPTKPPNTAYTEKEIKLLEKIMELNQTKKDIIVEILGSNRLLMANARDRIAELYEIEQNLKKEDYFKQIQFLRHLRQTGVLSAPSQTILSKGIEFIRRSDHTLEESKAVTTTDFQTIYQDWKSTQRLASPSSQSAIDYSQDPLFDPLNSILSAHHWLEKAKMVPDHSKPLPLHRTGRFDSQFDHAVAEYITKELSKSWNNHKKTQEQKDEEERLRIERSRDDYYYRHQVLDGAESAQGGGNIDGDDDELDDERFFNYSGAVRGNNNTNDNSSTNQPSSSSMTDSSIYDQIEKNRQELAAREKNGDYGFVGPKSMVDVTILSMGSNTKSNTRE